MVFLYIDCVFLNKTAKCQLAVFSQNIKFAITFIHSLGLLLFRRSKIAPRFFMGDFLRFGALFSIRIHADTCSESYNNFDNLYNGTDYSICTHNTSILNSRENQSIRNLNSNLSDRSECFRAGWKFDQLLDKFYCSLGRGPQA